MDPDGMWPTDPVKGFIARAKAYVKQKAKDVAYGGAAYVYSKAKSYVNQKIDSGKKAVNDFFNVESSKTTSKSSKSSSPIAFDFTVKNKDNANEGEKKEQGGRDVKELKVDVIIDLTNVYGPEGSRKQTTIVPTGEGDGNDKKTSNGNNSTMEDNVQEEKDVNVSYRSTTGTSSKTGSVNLPNFEVKDTVVPESKANEVYNNLEKKFHENYKKQLENDN